MRAHLLVLTGIVLVCATMAVGAQTESKPSSSQPSPTAQATPAPQATPAAPAPQAAPAAPAAQATPAPPATSTRKPVKAITLKGCLQGSSLGSDVYTLVDSKGETTYRVSGADVRPHVGHRVQIVGGLIPSPNVAAQAGAIDPVQAAIAGTGEHAAGPGSVHLELHVARVQPLGGTCGQP
jgi:hypothetical protein